MSSAMGYLAGPQVAPSVLRVKPHVIVMSLLFLGALAVGYLLLPGEGERIAMLERDGKGRQALQALERRFKAGDHSQHTLYQMQELYELFGELDKARTTLEMLARLRPRDASVQRRLALFYKQTQNEQAYITALQNQITLKYSEPACRELIGLLRLSGRYADEQAAIQQCRHRGYRRAEDLVRLAGLLTVDGDLAQASALLRSVDDLRRLKGESDKLKLFSILIELDQPREAQRRAVRWLRGTKDETLGISLIEKLIDEKRHDVAIELARDVSVPGDSISLAVAELMLDRGQGVAARSYLRGWIEKATFSSLDTASRFIAASLDAEDPENAMAGARKFGLNRLSQSDLVILAEGLAMLGRTAEFDEVRMHLSQETVGSNSLLAAAVQMRSGSRERTRRLLSEIQVDQLDEWRMGLWTRLMTETGGSPAASSGAAEPVRTVLPRAQSSTTAARILKRVKRARALRQRPAPVQQPSPAPASKSGSSSQDVFTTGRGGGG